MQMVYASVVYASSYLKKQYWDGIICARLWWIGFCNEIKMHCMVRCKEVCYEAITVRL